MTDATHVPCEITVNTAVDHDGRPVSRVYFDDFCNDGLDESDVQWMIAELSRMLEIMKSTKHLYWKEADYDNQQ